MSKKKRGPKKKTGPRESSGRICRSRDYGNVIVQSRAMLFRAFGGDSGIGFEMTCAGRLMLVGAFDGMDEPPETILATLLAYSDAYWGNYGGGPKMGSFERGDKEHDNSWEDPRGIWFRELERRLADAGHGARSAVLDVSVNRHWFPEENAAWADRIINTALVKKRLPVAGLLACDSDLAMLELLRHGAMALVGNRMRRAA